MANKIKVTTMKRQTIIFLLLIISMSSFGQITATATATNENCGQSNGTATVTPGGVCSSGFTYLWNTSPQQITQTATNLSTGIYTVTVYCGSDSATASAIINNLPGPSVTITNFTNATCSLPNGSATASPFGGSPPYTYEWNSSPAQYTDTLFNVESGTYNVTITDGNNCTAMNTVNITDTPGPSCIITDILDATNGQSNGALTLDVNGGASPYSFLWNSSPIQTTQNLQNVPAGTYSVTVTDGNGCTTTTIATVGNSSSVDEIKYDVIISIFPNPTTGIFSIDLSNINDTDFSIDLSDIIGKIVYTEKMVSTSNKIFNIDISGLTKGFYCLRIYSKDFTIKNKILKE